MQDINVMLEPLRALLQQIGAYLPRLMVALGVLVVGWLVFKAQRQPSRGGAEGMLGEIGEVRRGNGAGGRLKVFVRGEIWDADSDDALAVGEAVEVVAIDGLRVRVRRRTS